MLESRIYKSEIEDYVNLNQDYLCQEWTGKSIMISGAAGLIGSYMIDLLMTANKLLGTNIVIYAIDKNKDLLEKRFPNDNLLNLLPLNVNIDALPDVDVDVVIHAASNTSPLDYGSKPVDTIKTNVFGTDNMIQFSIDHAKRFLFCSSVEMYGANNGDTDEFKEDYSGYVNANTIRSCYPTAKRLSETLCNAYLKENPAWQFVIARIGRIYGPTVIEGDTKAPTQFIMNAVNNRDIVIKSAGNQEFSYGYVGDCVMGLLYIISRGENGEAYNIAYPQKVLLKEFAQAVAKAGNCKLTTGTFTEAEKAGYSSITKATMCMDKLESLGWNARYNVAEGVTRTIDILKEIKK